LETDTDNFITFFIDIWPVVDILLATDTDIPKFVYRYICRYFNNVFWLKLVWTAYTSLVHFSNNINQYKCVYVTITIAKQCFTNKTCLENFFWKNSNKIRRFFLIKMNLVQIVLSINTPEIMVEIQKVKYRPLISVNRYIGRL